MKAGLRSRPHCTCVVVQNYGYEKAAEKLGCRRRFLEDRIRKLPHQKIGEAAVFCDCDLRLIQAMFTVIPAEVEAQFLTPALEDEKPPAPTLRSIKPAGARRTAVR